MQAFVMNYFVTCFLCVHTCAIAFMDNNISNTGNKMVINDTHFIEFPDDDGVVHRIKTPKASDSKFFLTTVNDKTNSYFLYTRKNMLYPEKLIINDEDSITQSNFNASTPTVIIVHGWTGNLNSGVNVAVRNAKSNYNVIVLDWSRVASQNYVTAVAGVPQVGQHLGRFISFLSLASGMSLDSIHLIGHSLGAHVVGNAGRYLNGQAARITGLDPAGPLWTENSKRLQKTDAVYVEAIHTNSGVYGTVMTVADVDFFPNGGAVQPNCATNVCNHKRSWELFASSVTFNNLEGRKCSSVLQLTVNECRGAKLKLGNDDLQKMGSGIYRLKTKGKYPF